MDDGIPFTSFGVDDVRAEYERLKGLGVRFTQPTTSILTLGYDPAEDRFVGSWIDSMQTHFWSYPGTLDDSGTALTLETEGPILGDPTRTARYREVLEVVDADHRVWRTLILGPDGEWFEFAWVEYRREG